MFKINPKIKLDRKRYSKTSFALKVEEFNVSILMK